MMMITYIIMMMMMMMMISLIIIVGTAGDNCETDLNECSTNPCDNEGMCQNLVNSFKCHCAAGYGGAK